MGEYAEMSADHWDVNDVNWMADQWRARRWQRADKWHETIKPSVCYIVWALLMPWRR